MGTILILGREEDTCCRLVQEQLTGAGCHSWLLAEHQLFPHLRLTWKLSITERQGVLAYNDITVPFADISGVLSRFHGLPFPAEDFYTPDGQYISAEWNALLMAWLHWLPCRVVNRLRPELWYKPYLNVPDLVSLVPTLRFKLPRALVTTASADARAFCQSLSGPVRYSPLTQPARYRIHTEDERERLATLEGSLPFYLTEWIDGKALDAFVMGSAVVFVEPNGHLAQESASPVKAHCVEIGAALGLEFYRLSLIKTVDGDWYCLSLDRVPQVYGCTPDTQREIARALAHCLSANVEYP